MGLYFASHFNLGEVFSVIRQTSVVTDAPVEFEKLPVEVQDSRTATRRFTEPVQYTAEINTGTPKDHTVGLGNTAAREELAVSSGRTG